MTKQTASNPIPPWPQAFNHAPKWAVERADIFELELQRIFSGPIWHLVAHRSELDQPGRFKRVTVGLTPLLLVHGDDGTIRALHNACAHRGTMLENRFRGSVTNFECPYHRWAYNLDGSLLRCPGEQDFPATFERSNHGLKHAQVSEIHGLIFVSLHPTTPDLDSWLSEISKPLQASMGNDGRLNLLGYQKVIFDANWKIYMDDEGYHAPLLHKAFQLLRWRGSQGSQKRARYGHRVTDTTMDNQTDGGGLLKDQSLIDYRGGNTPKNKLSHQQAGSLLVTPWPLGAIMNHLDLINIRFATPLSPTQTEVHYAYFAHQDDDAEMYRHRLRQASNLIGPSGFISLEDGAVFARIQKAIHTQPEQTYYLRGWQDSEGYDPYSVSQNDETTNTVWWEMYRKTMGFEREATVDIKLDL